MGNRLFLGLALDGAGWHPAAWREDDARPHELFDPSYWVDVVQRADAGQLDFVTFEDGLRLQSDRFDRPDDRTDRVRGRLDAVLIASRVAPVTRHVGLIPTVNTTHTEPFHVSKAIATLDYVSQGRAGVRVQVSHREDEAGHFGRRDDLGDLIDEAADYVEVVRRLWDSWEDGAEIRDVATGRFVDRDKLHYVDFAGRWFSVRGPSITPRPPQGQPIVAALGHGPRIWPLIAGSADIGFVTPTDSADAARIVAEIRQEGEAKVLADAVVHLGATRAEAEDRRARLDDRAGPFPRNDAFVFTGTAPELADLVEEWVAAGLDGFRLRPATIPHDLDLVVGRVVPQLQRRGRFPDAQVSGDLRSRFGLDRPASRYART